MSSKSKKVGVNIPFDADTTQAQVTFSNAQKISVSVQDVRIDFGVRDPENPAHVRVTTGVYFSVSQFVAFAKTVERIKEEILSGSRDVK